MAFDRYGNSRKRTYVTMADIDSMGGLEFESFVGELLKSIGYSGVQVTKSSGDQGVDVIAHKDGKKYAIQCKNYSSPLNNKPIQEVTTGKAIYGCDVGVVLTNSTFNSNAVEAARATGTLLWDRSTLKKMLEQSPMGKPRIEVERRYQPAPAVQNSPVQVSPTPKATNTAGTTKPRNVVLYVIGTILLWFSGIGLFAGVVACASSGISGDDIPPFVFLLILFALGLFWTKRNKKTDGTTKTGSYHLYIPYTGKKTSWVAVGLCLYFFFPVGFYLLCKKMSQYKDAEELQRNSRTLKNWATVFMCFGGFSLVMALTGTAEVLIAVAVFVGMGIISLSKSKSLSKLYDSLPNSPMEQQLHQGSSNAETVIEEPASEIHSGGNFSEYRYHAGKIDSTYVVVHCKGCNAPNRIVKGKTCECEYCGSLVGEHMADEITIDNEEVAITKAFAVIQRLLESLDEVSDDLSDGFDRLTHAMETFPNRSMPLDVEINHVSDCIRNFSGEAKRISAGVRAQVLIACDNLMAYDDDSWAKVETEIEQFNEIKATLSETISSMRSFRHSMDNLNVNAGFQTYRIKTAQLQLVKEIDQAITILQSAMSDFTESLKSFRNAKFTSKTERINTQKQRGGRM